MEAHSCPTEAFLDTNILVRHVTRDVPEQADRATAYLLAIERGERRVHFTETVVFETVYVLSVHYGIPRSAIRDAILPILDLSGMLLPGKRRFHDIFALYVERNVPFADAYHAVTARHMDLPVLSFDRDFDRIPGIERVEP